MTNKECLMKNHFDEFLDEIISSFDYDDICIADILIKYFPHYSTYSFGRGGCNTIGCKKCINDFLDKEYEV